MENNKEINEILDETKIESFDEMNKTEPISNDLKNIEDNTNEKKSNIDNIKYKKKIRNWIIFYVLFFMIVIITGILSQKLRKPDNYDYEIKTAPVENMDKSNLVETITVKDETPNGNTLDVKVNTNIYNATTNAFLNFVSDYIKKMKDYDYLKVLIDKNNYLLFNKELSACTYYQDGKDYNLSFQFQEKDVYEVLELGKTNPFLGIENVEYVNAEGFLVD